MKVFNNIGYDDSESDSNSELIKHIKEEPSDLLSSDVNYETTSNYLHVEKSPIDWNFIESFTSKTFPDGVVLRSSSHPNAVVGIFTNQEIKKGTVFGPYAGLREGEDTSDSVKVWEIFMNYMDAQDQSYWMRFINRAISPEDQNMESFQDSFKIYYKTIKDVPAESELLVWYSSDFIKDVEDTQKSNVMDENADSLNITSNLLHELPQDHNSMSVTSDYNMTSDDSTFEDNNSINDIKMEIKSERLSSDAEESSSNTNRKHDKNVQWKVRMKTGSPKKRFKCEVCGFEFKVKCNLKKHMRTHTGEKPYKCDVCGTAFSHENSWKEHVRIHTGEKPYKCNVCGYAFRANNNLKKHIKIHTGEKSFKCEVCNSAFTLKGQLTVHKRTHTGEKPFNCSECSSVFAQRNQLKLHMRVHTGEKPFKCKECCSAFAYHSNLREHMRTHTGEKPYKCNMCQVAFSLSSNLKKHMQIHTDEKPYDCKVCSSSFRLNGDLKKHMKTHSN